MFRARTLAALAAAAVLPVAAVGVPAATAASASKPKVLARFVGKTSQGKKISVFYVGHGHGLGTIGFSTKVVGTCPVTGLGQAQETENVADNAHGSLPIPSRWSWDTKKPTYEITMSRVQRGRKLSGTLSVVWHTNIDNMPTCTAKLSWHAKR